MKNIKALLLLVTASLLVTSCGSDSSSSNNGGFFTPNGSSNNYTSESEYQLYGQLASAFQCRTGQRKGQDVVAHVQGASSQTTIGGNFQNGAMSGSSGLQYVGVTVDNDFMIVTEVVNGNQVVGHNIRLSLCERYIQPQQYGNNFPIISDRRQITGVQAQMGIVLDKNVGCPYGLIDSAQKVAVIVGNYNYNFNGMQGTLQQTGMEFYFYPPQYQCQGSGQQQAVPYYN